MCKILFSSRIFAFFLIILMFLSVSIVADDLSFEVIKTHPTVIFVVQLADIDHDGYTDIIYAGDGADINLKIMYGREDNNFDPPVVFPYNVRTMALDYVDGDTLLDIIGSSFHYMCIFLNNGDRTFTVNQMANQFTNIDGVATGYFNNDQYLDVIANYYYIYFGDGTGNFPSTKTFPFYCQTVYCSDFNNDGIDDVVALDYSGDGAIFLNDGDANFTAGAAIDLPDYTMATSITNPFADFNLDGNADFAFLTPVDWSDSSRITIGFGDGTGGISSLETLNTPGTAYSLAIADINRDNILDLIASDATHKVLVLFEADGAGIYSDSSIVDMQSDSIAHAMCTGDIDLDGNPDFVVGALGRDSVTLAINLLPDQPVLSNSMLTNGFSNITLDISNPNGFRISRIYQTVAGSDYRRLDVNGDNYVDIQTADFNLQYGEYKIVIKSKLNAEAGSLFSSTINIGNEVLTLFKDYESPQVYAIKDGGYESDSMIFYYTVEEHSSMQPANGKKASPTPTFDWTALVAYYPFPWHHFQLDNDYYFDSPLIDTIISTPQFTPETPLENGMYYWRFRSDDSGWTQFSRTFAVEIVDNICGDVNYSGAVNLLDITYIIFYIYKGGPAPNPLGIADVNNDSIVNILDLTYLINYLYQQGPEPMCP